MHMEGMTMRLPFSNETTSLDAARSMRGALERLEALVLTSVQQAVEAGRFGMTGEQVAQANALRIQSATARIRGLVLKGELKDSGLRHRNSSGRMAIVWTLGDRQAIGEAVEHRDPQIHGRVAAAVRRTWAAAADMVEQESVGTFPEVCAALRRVAGRMRERGRIE